ncbi:MAG: AAA family ATPase [Aquamicrobium sp.]|uniref:bifunctional aminoglycoside phosphotransferase/ATP-binding protein n=1 Tax=Aquamicrobium sp. TaxID=1872579 RepID=UPI00349EE7BB|nr:AAA family ATPase [Aquamicrobium sp.]
MRIETQDEALAFLRAELARRDGQPPETAETHISLVLLGRSIAWKLKKAVRQPYLDFSTPERRLALCERELELNRRTAPGLYRRVRRLTRTSDGTLTLDDEGTPVEAVLEMARFDEDKLLDRMARRGALSLPLIARLAATIAAFHADAPTVADARTSGSARIEAVLRINEAGLEAGRAVFGDAATEAAVQAMRALWRRHRPLLDARQREGKVRRCHGDLHLRNIVEIDGEPVLFDCLEFDEEMATIDILYDLAFLVMDLWHRDLGALANLVFNRYLDAANETAGLPLMPLFLAMRATVRAHVTASQALQGGADADALAEEARAYLDLARALAAPPAPRLVAIGGYSGSGKSTAAARIAHAIGPAPGARILSSDRIRKALFGVAAETRLPDEAYRPEVSGTVYARQCEEAARILAAGHGVIADAVAGRPEERAAIEAVAAAAGVDFAGFWLEAPERMLVERVEARRGDPSDATASVVRAQLGRDPGPMGWRRIDTRDGEAAERIAAHL